MKIPRSCAELWHAFACGNTSCGQWFGGPPSGCCVTSSGSCRSVSDRSRRLAARIYFCASSAYRERRVKPRRADDATRITLVMLSRLIDWRAVLTIVTTRHADPVASQRVPALLAVEVEEARPASTTGGCPAADCRHGSCECDVGRGADCRRTAAQAWPVRVAAYGEALHATEWATPRSRVVPAVEHLRAQPCQCRCSPATSS